MRQVVEIFGSREALRGGSMGCHVSNGTVQHELLFPASAFMKAVVRNIFSGAEYPVFRLPGYSPVTMLDVGANIGAAAVYFHDHFPNCRIYCYEPSRENLQYLRVNLETLPAVEIHGYGLLDRTCDLPLYPGWNQCAQNSLHRSRETAGEPSETVPLVETAEELRRRGLSEVSIIKIDTEGCELPILRQWLEHLRRIDWLYLEYHREDDRREIDRLVNGRFLMAASYSRRPQRGTVVYVSASLAQQFWSPQAFP